MSFNIDLVYPEIPQNTGNIARTCSVTGAKLHLVKPLGFSIDDASLKRAGLDYWDELDVEVYDNLEDVDLKEIKTATGFGVRIKIKDNPRMNFRIDFAYSNESQGTYFTLMEAF